MVWALLVLVLVVDPRRYANRSWLEIGGLGALLAASTLLMRVWTFPPSRREVAADYWLRVTSSPKALGACLMLVVALWLLLRPAPPDPVAVEEHVPAETRALLPAEG
jgi:hypothetical protein